MQLAEAFVSGSLGQAIYREDGAFRVIDAPNAEPRDALPNEVQWFRHAAREVAPAHPEGLPVSIDRVRTRLDEEIRFFSGLDGLLVGMDRDFSEATRGRAISRAEGILAADDGVARRIRHRFLIPANAQEWDPAGGLALALRNAAKAAADYYRPLADGIIDRLADDIGAVVLEKLGSGVDAGRAREAILRSGVLAELALVEARADRAAFAALLFRRSEFPKLRAVDASGQIFAAIVRRMEKRTTTASKLPIGHEVTITDGTQEGEAVDPIDPITAAVDRALTNFGRRKHRSMEGSSADLPGIQREIAWIGERLKFGETTRAEKAIIKLIDRQARRSRAEDIVKTLTAVADLARGAKLFDWTSRLLAAIDLIGGLDAAAASVRAETLRDLGRHDEALAAFEDTMRRFPQDAVAPNARAETLRDLGHHHEALAAFEDTMRRFPQDAVAPTARAETLRDLGRHDEALAAFEDIMRRFPQNEVAPNARAETLRDLGRHGEALAAFEDTMRRFPQDEVAANARAETLRDLGRHDEALAALEDTMRRFPQNEVAPNARAETLRDLGRLDEALAAFEDTMRHFPQNVVAPTARAEALRDLGRYDEALAALEDTMRRFPQDAVARNAYAHLLGDRGRITEAEALLGPAATRLRTRNDWIAAHILAMAQLRAGRVDEALAAFDRGVRSCVFRDTRGYFETARPLALLAKRRAAEAAQQWEALAKNPMLPRQEMTNIVLFQAHALAEAGEPRRARTLVESAQIVDFAAARQRRLAAAITERYGLASGVPASAARAQELSGDISTLEFELVRPKLWTFRAIGRAA